MDEGDVKMHDIVLLDNDDQENSISNNNKKKRSTITATKLYKDRMNGVAQKKPIRPSISPVTPSNTPYVSQTWKEYYEQIMKNKEQTKIDLEWIDLSSRLQQTYTIYIQEKSKTYVFESERNKAIINLLKESIPEDHNSEKMRWKRVYDLLLSLVVSGDKLKIPFELYHKMLRELNMTINYLQSVDKDEFEDLKKFFLDNCSKMKDYVSHDILSKNQGVSMFLGLTIHTVFDYVSQHPMFDYVSQLQDIFIKESRSKHILRLIYLHGVR
ncbi:6512_t:CDS:2 [Cetraspora pellucida]|uniref:6512_t:CDS:1 n=1 Tax=Cetraspora pellucida TaxID=1433469 RepID=A0A9N9I4G8_9GLOM|nr:6512_t:CDS:2 [Cetraspora pellucida]